jgi:60Kd inner membrane protein
LNMRFVVSALFLANAAAFSPSVRSSQSVLQRPSYGARSTSTARSLGIDPSHFTDALQQFASTSVMLSDAMDGLANAAASMDSLTDAVTSAVSTAPVSPDVVVEAASDDNGWFGFLTYPIEGLLQIIHTAIAATGTANAWGVTIIVLTILIKVVTFPLTKTQLESTNKMQAMAPAIKELQAKYQSNPEVMNQKIAVRLAPFPFATRCFVIAVVVVGDCRHWSPAVLAAMRVVSSEQRFCVETVVSADTNYSPFTLHKHTPHRNSTKSTKSTRWPVAYRVWHRFQSLSAYIEPSWTWPKRTS